MKPPSGKPDHHHRVAARHEAVTACLIALRDEMVDAHPLAARDDAWEIVLAEACTNIVEHALAERPGAAFTLSAWLRDDAMYVRLRDRGLPMPTGYPPPPCAAPPRADTLPEGGFGWSIIGRLCRRVRFARRAGENRLDLVIPFFAAARARK
ncbi:ATP-binding protein [Citreimonas salinaria]|uniref:Histidine kinase-like ATPase domain-containing protein n=1 Tax=Citreimonas salinaria TaxID=321339 RepID=A0A1H3HW26_9RHOB|nr:ATP-binding protein [Citreimonas salinaria]SDY19666.1 Histidine kinase-like ATPase domain-containing protein [Citreimonas salinaria]